MMEEYLLELLPVCEPEQVWDALRPHLCHPQLSVRLAFAPMELDLLAHLPVERVVEAARGAPEIAAALGRLSRPYHDQLDAVSSRLITELGRDGPAARAIAARAASTPTAVWSVATFIGEQARRVRSWAKSDRLELKAWANALANDLEQEAARRHDDEDFDRKFG